MQEGGCVRDRRAGCIGEEQCGFEVFDAGYLSVGSNSVAVRGVACVTRVEDKSVDTVCHSALVLKGRLAGLGIAEGTGAGRLAVGVNLVVAVVAGGNGNGMDIR